MEPKPAADLRETNRVFEDEVIAKRDYGALAQVYTRHARVLPPGSEMIEGREQIEAFWQQAASALELTSVQLRTVDIEYVADVAIEIGRATLTTKSAVVEVKYVVVWKQEDGKWKWHVDIWNPVA
jgi:ketosteroid isomerase-like protein